MKLKKIAHARSGDKGNHANIGVIAFKQGGFDYLKNYLSEEKVQNYFKTICKGSVTRYVLPNLKAFNFLLTDSLGGGAGTSLRTDSQGKLLGSALLEMEIPEPDNIHEMLGED